MVTKQCNILPEMHLGSVLAKIFMVTKHNIQGYIGEASSVLAKIFMVTKQSYVILEESKCSVLAKIFMVTKLLS